MTINAKRASDLRLDELRAQAQHAHQRYALYKAKAYGPRLTSLTRLRDLEREAARTDAGLRFAEAESRRDTADGQAVSGSQPPT
ncbi:MAG: hypothetical protein ACLP50_19420 [Solirubrobacteraceae bacterium]